jgi:hypothetical protein
MPALLPMATVVDVRGVSKSKRADNDSVQGAGGWWWEQNKHVTHG